MSAHRHNPKLQAVLDGAHRSSAHKARDRYRHPYETLEFFGIEQKMAVAEIWPGSVGWYTEILAPYLRDTGKYIGASYDVATETSFDPTKSQRRFEDKLQAEPHLYDKVEMRGFSAAQLDFAPPASCDLVLVMRLHHIFMLNDYLDAATQAFFRILKPGGVLGVVEHREAPERPLDPKGKRGYVHEDYVVEKTVKAGFTLDSRSEINSNPHDIKDYPKDVWSLPPWMIDVPDEQRTFYQDIGESDRMTLRFLKPAL